MRHTLFGREAAVITVVVVSLATSALLVARGVGALVAAELEVAGPAPLAVRIAAPPSISDRERSVRAILARNPFDHVTGPLDGVREGETPQRTSCEGIRVVTIVLSDDPAWSFAALRRDGETRSVLGRRESTFGDKRVERIAYDRVWLASGADACVVEMGRTKAGPVAASAPEREVSGVRRRGATEFDVERSTVDRILEDHAELMKFVRISPDKVGGRVVGLRLAGIRPGTLLATLGMEEGDRLESINGYDLTSPEQALEAYARLRVAERLVVRVVRRGQPVELDYRIR